MVSIAHSSPLKMDLSGDWRFALDKQNQGIEQKWFAGDLKTTDTIHLPGSLQEEGFGDKPSAKTEWTTRIGKELLSEPRFQSYIRAEDFKCPFWLQPYKYYKGAAWYQKTVTISKSWENKHITLTLERPHWETTVWIDSHTVGSANHLSTPHLYDLSQFLTPGKHTLTIRVDNRVIVDVGANSHSISDHTQSNWNGIVGKIELQADPAAWIEDVLVYPDLKSSSVKVQVQFGNRTGQSISGQLILDVLFNGRKVKSSESPFVVDSALGGTEIIVPLGDNIKVWDEFNPNLYKLKIQFLSNAGEDEHETVFGMREVTTKENRIILNGLPAFMRGTLECCIFPKTGYPPTDVKAWKRIINICKNHGLNHIRFHSWCPPEAAFIAADKLGFYYQVECSSWANGGSSIGDGKPVDAWLYKEADAILKAYGNHPSFLLFAYGNEPAGPERGAAYLRKWVSHYKQEDSRRLVTSASAWPLIKESDYHVTPGPRIQGWGQELKSRINSKAPETMTDYSGYIKQFPNQPTISHEIGQWCVYPNFDEMKKYTGVLKPKNFEVFREFLKQKNMLDQAHDFLMASGKLQTLCYKEEIESALRTPHFGGFQLLDLHDFPGQGTALVGVLDPFWDSKPYVSPEEYNRFCGPVVPLARLSKRVFTSSETLSAQVDVSQFGPTDLSNVNIKWFLLDTAGKTVRQGTLHKDQLPAGDLYTMGDIKIVLSDLSIPAKYKLQLAIEKTTSANDWDIWVYPDTVTPPADDKVRVAHNLTPETIDYLRRGGKVLLALNPATVKTDVKIGFSSIFWNTAWTGGQAPHTLGILCDPKHPALADFPTEYHSNWQWSSPIRNAAAIPMDHLPKSLRPIIQVVPDWFEPQKLGLVFEAKVGTGSLVVCSVNISDNLDSRPVERQLKYSLLRYMNSKYFNPKIEVDIAAVQDILNPTK
ncbi:MAG: glycoside hydrolase [Planctomycetes bacterium]|nr:glycoside hydrolase [Planctomycetota bacterium]